MDVATPRLWVSRLSTRELFSALLRAHAVASADGWSRESRLVVDQLFARYHARLLDEVRAHSHSRRRRTHEQQLRPARRQAAPGLAEIARPGRRVVHRIGLWAEPEPGGTG